MAWSVKLRLAYSKLGGRLGVMTDSSRSSSVIAFPEAWFRSQRPRSATQHRAGIIGKGCVRVHVFRRLTLRHHGLIVVELPVPDVTVVTVVSLAVMV